MSQKLYMGETLSGLQYPFSPLSILIVIEDIEKKESENMMMVISLAGSN